MNDGEDEEEDKEIDEDDEDDGDDCDDVKGTCCCCCWRKMVPAEFRCNDCLDEDRAFKIMRSSGTCRCGQ
jgi:hypothetical protein